MRSRAGGMVLPLLALLVLTLASLSATHAASQTAPPKLVQTTTCDCPPVLAGTSTTPRFRGPPAPPSNNAYDEQLGMTFTQSFTSLEYNVTAIVQTDPTLDTGPAYLVNGLTNVGYWYQVGVSWNWSPGDTPGTGFDMNYEVFNPSQVSVFPSNGGGGLQSFSGTVNQGDLVTLNLYFSTTNQVVMEAKDANTGAVASVSYGAMGGSYFTGSPTAVANSNGYFTGLMNEWYHGNPFYANGKVVTFSDPQFELASAWMWMDEFNANSLKEVFSAAAAAPVSYSPPNTLQEFSYNGTLEYSDAYEFITGNATSTTTGVYLTLSYGVQGGGSGFQPPVLTYVSGGTKSTATLTSSATTYQVDPGSTWSVSKTLDGSSSSERWQTDQIAAGVASDSLTTNFLYYHQFLVTFGLGISGGGSGYSPPTVTYTMFGSPEATNIPSSSQPSSEVWADAGSRYNYTNPLSGSNSEERWYANPRSGTVVSSGALSVTYYHQFLVVVDATFSGSVIFPSVSLKSTSGGSSFTGTIVEGANSYWLDAGAQYSVPQTLSLFQGERWAANTTTSGTISGELTIPLAYEYEYLVGFAANVEGGGTISTVSGWYLPGAALSVTATPNSGWQVEGWTGTGSGSSSSSGASLTLQVSGPANETASFYPGLTIYSSGPLSVSYQDGSISGTVPAGKNIVVYVPPSSTVSLRSSSTPFFYSFTGWSGASTSHASSISFLVVGPESVTASSSYNYVDIALIVAAAIVLALGVLLARGRPRNQGAPVQEKTVGSPAA